MSLQTMQIPGSAVFLFLACARKKVVGNFKYSWEGRDAQS